MNRRSARAGLTVAVAALLMSGCGLFSSTPPTAAPAVSQDTASATPSATDTSPTLAPRPPAPAGTKWVSAKRSGVEFVVPSTWQIFNLTTLLDSADTAKLNEVAASLHVATSQLRTLAKTVDLYVMDPAKASFRANVETLLTSAAELPTRPELSTQLKQVGLTVTSTDEVETEAGTVMTVAYRGTAAAKSFHGRSIFVATDKGVVDITVTAATAAGVQQVASPLLATLRPYSA
jgi:hypothetical protein